MTAIQKGAIETTTIITVTAIGERKEWLKETALSVKREKEAGVSILWFLCVRGSEKLPPEVALVTDYVIRMPYNTHVSKARNELLKMVTSEYLCTLDDDDVLIANGLKRRIDLLDNRPELGWVSGYMQDMDISGNMGEIWNQPAVAGDYEKGDLVKLWSSPKNWFICISHAFLIRTDIVRKIEGWQEISQEDILLVCQVSEISQGAILPVPMVAYRRHSNQISRSAIEIAIREEASQYIFLQLGKES